MIRVLWFVTATVMVACPAFGQSPLEKTEIRGLVFGDYYWVATNHDEPLEGRNGLWFRRIYLDFDTRLTESVDTRLRFEMNSPGDFETSGGLDSPLVKDAWLQWKGARHKAVFGLSPSPTFAVIEKAWGYRFVEKTAVDLQRFASSRDLGVALLGSLTASGSVGYHLMLGNGSGTGTETNKGKKAMLAVNVKPTAALLFEGYADYEDRPGDTDRTIVQGFVGVTGGPGRLGVQYTRQTREVEGGPDDDLDLASVFGVLNFHPRASLLARYDRLFDPNPEGARIAYLPFDPRAESNLVILGVDLRPLEGLSVVPNLEIVFYDELDGGETPDTDVIPRVTFFYQF